MPSPAAVLAIQVDANTAQAQASLTRLQGSLEKTAAVAKTSSDSMATRMAAASSKMKSAGASMTKYVSLPLIGIGAAAVKTSIDFNKSMTLIQTQAGASAKEVENMRKAILRFAASGKTSFTPNDLAQGLYAIESAGLRGADALNTLKQSSNLAMIGQTDLASTTKALTAAQKSGIDGAQNLKKAIGTLNATVGAGQMHMTDLLSAMGTGFLSTASQLGLNLSDVNAALAELTKQGMPAAQSATRLRMAFSLMAAPSTTAATALKTIGLGASDLATTMRQKGLLAALQQLQDHLKGLSKVQQTQTLSAAFGGGRTSAGILALLGNLKDLDKTMQSIHDHAGKVNEDLKKARETKSEELQIEWAKLQAVMVKLGDKLIPVVIPALQKLSDVAIHMLRIFNGAPSWVADFLVGAVAVGPIVRMAGALGSMVSSSKKLMGMGSPPTTVAGNPANAAGNVPPIGPLGIAAATATGIGAGYYINKQYHPVQNLLTKQIPSAFDTLGKSIHHLTDTSVKDLRAFGSQSDDTFHIASDAVTALERKYPDLIAAGHDMDAHQRKAWIDLALQAENNGQITFNQLHRLTTAFTNNSAQWRQQMQKAAQATGQSTKQIANSVGDSAVHVSKAYDGMVKVVGNGLNWLTSNTSKAAQALGVKKQINFHTTPTHVQGTVGNEHVAGLQKGGMMVGGVGSGDKVPAMLEPGEFVLNREAVKGLGQARLESLNKAIPRFASGGSVKLLPGVNMSQGQEPSILRDLGTFSRLMHKVVYVISGYRSPAHSVAVGGFANDPHTKGAAADIGLGSPTLASMYPMGLDSPLRQAGLYRPFYPPSQAEANHVQLLAGAAAAAAKAPQLRRLLLKGPNGALNLRGTGQAALDHVYNAGKHFLASIKPTVGRAGYVSGGGGSVVSQIGRILLGEGFNKVGAAGIIGNAYAESSWNPGAVGTGGGGLWGFTTPPISLADLQAYARSQHKSWTDVGLQTQFMLNHGGMGLKGALNNSGSAAAAATLFMNQWERPGIPRLDVRIAGAQKALAMGYQRGGQVMPPYGGSFANGGVVPGPMGAPRTIVAHGGEHVGGQPIIHNHIHVDGTDLSEFISFYSNVEYEENAGLSRQIARQR